MSTETVSRMPIPCVGCWLMMCEEDAHMSAQLAGIYMLNACIAHGLEDVRTGLCPIHRDLLERSEAARLEAMKKRCLMSEQSHVWRQFMAASMAHGVYPQLAAEIADKALALYNERMGALTRLERELAEAVQAIDVREQQVSEAIDVLIRIDGLIAEWKGLSPENILRVPYDINRRLEELDRDVKRHLGRNGNRYVFIPFGLGRPPADDPRLQPWRKP